MDRTVIDPFSSPDETNKDKNKTKVKTVQDGMDENITIIYITIGVIVFLIILYIIFIIFSHEPNVGIINEMLKDDNQTKLITDDDDDQKSK